jgi:hypothetical protein
MKDVISSIIMAIGAIKSAAFLEADEGKLGAGDMIGVGASMLVAGACAEIAIHQLADAILLAAIFGDDPGSWCGQDAGNDLHQFGL